MPKKDSGRPPRPRTHTPEADRESFPASPATRDAAILEAVPHVVWTTRSDGATTYLNRRGTDVLGITADALSGWKWLDLLHPDDVDRSRQCWQAAVIAGTEYVNEYRLRQADGSYRWYLAQAAPLRQGDGAALGWVGTWTDIDDRRRSEERHQRDAHLLANVRDCIIVTDPAGIVTYWNDAATRLFGWTVEEMLGQPLVNRYPEEARVVVGEMTRHIADGHDWSGEFEDYRKDGSRVWIDARVSRICSPSGQPLGIIGISHDITERRRAEEALRTSEERFRQIAESISEVFWLTTPDKREMAYVSPAYETIWGRTREALYASPGSWMEAIHPDDRERVARAAARQADGAYDEEYRIVLPDGTIRWIRDRAFPVRDRDGQIVRVAGVAEDVTERRQLETRLRQAQKTEAIGLLAGGVAHDFNNLLTVINGCSELLLDAIGDRPDLRELLEEIRKAGERSASLTRQLLAFSRRQVLAPAILDVNDVVHDMEQMLRRLIGEHVELSTAPQRPLGRVKADRGQLEQVLLNLAVNARDAMPHGGRLTIETREVDLTGDDSACPPGIPPGRYITLAVTDSGVGMSDEVRRHLFEPFFTTKPAGKGTGLGLAVVHGFVKQCGGGVEVHSEPGVGTCFTIYLLRVEAPRGPDAGAGEPEVAPAHGTETILLIEDDDAVRALTKRVLQQYGYTVLEASRGDDGLRLAEAHRGPIHLLITDVVMPGIPGRLVAEQIGESHPETKVLYVSGYTNDDVVRTGVRYDAVHFMQKPFAPAALAEKVREILTP